MKQITKWMPALALGALFVATPALAAEGAEGADNLWRGYVGIGFGLALGLAVIGGTLGQGMAASSAFQSIARNPAAAGKLNAPFFVGMALIESLVLFGWIMVLLVNFGALSPS
jgi:F-type H+-transporting ATPase subunit c